MNPTFP